LIRCNSFFSRLHELIEDISDEKKLPTQVVEAALRKPFSQGYERYPPHAFSASSEDPFEEITSAIFLTSVDLRKRATRGSGSRSSSKNESDDHQIGPRRGQQVPKTPRSRTTVVLDYPGKGDFAGWAASTTNRCCP